MRRSDTKVARTKLTKLQPILPAVLEIDESDEVQFELEDFKTSPSGGAYAPIAVQAINPSFYIPSSERYNSLTLYNNITC